MKGDWGSRFRTLGRHTDAVLAIGVIGLILLLIIPLPPLLLDTLLCISIVFSVMALLLTIYVENALEFSAFPSVLLFLTLFRLGLNISSTRMILTQAQAGDIIHTFGVYVTKGSILVGFILFLLLTVINFIVVTKGAGRIAEVAARFTLEALPGKQMAIDSELTSGLISHEDAKRERKKMANETDFYGAMDGASKFVKGDAIASLIITCVNILGGFVVGMAVKKLSWQECWKTMTCLTIGDGLVSQIPALLISIGAAIMVTRASSGSLGKTLPKQFFHHPKVMLISGGALLFLSFVPGMPMVVMVPTSMVLLLIGYLQTRHLQPREKEFPLYKEGRLFVHPLEVQLGYQIVLFAEPLQEQVSEIRHQIMAHLGVRLPSVAISDHAELSPTGWRILVRGVRVASGRDPEFAFLVRKLKELFETYVHELLNRQDVAQMVQEIKNYDSAVVDELIPKKLSIGQILKVLQNLLKEKIPIRDFVTILEVLADHGRGENSDLDQLTEEVRRGLSRGISEEFFGKTHTAHVITLDPKVEQMLDASKGSLRPKAIDKLSRSLTQLNEKAKKQGLKPVVVTKGCARASLRRVIENQLPELHVLSYQEVASDVELQTVGVVSNEVLS